MLAFVDGRDDADFFAADGVVYFIAPVYGVLVLGQGCREGNEAEDRRNNSFHILLICFSWC
jgi:hypothetical protein